MTMATLVYNKKKEHKADNWRLTLFTSFHILCQKITSIYKVILYNESSANLEDTWLELNLA